MTTKPKKRGKITETQYSDAQILNWLSDCASIDHSGYDGGYAFNRTIVTDGAKAIGVADVKIAVRGHEGVDGLRKQATIAMGVDETMAENPWLRSSRGSK